MKRQYRVGILGATGAVGQRFVSLLARHPWFEPVSLMASGKSKGKPYPEACLWHLDDPIPEYCSRLTVEACLPAEGLDLVFSGLDAGVAGSIETDFASFGTPVISNARTHRLVKDVPLIVPEINSEHLSLIESQKKRLNSEGFIVTNPNCSTIILSLALAPLQAKFGLEDVVVTTLQALSGAGYPGPGAMDILDNIIPYIPGEEEKIQTEPLKIFGTLSGNSIVPKRMNISARCHRVQVTDGHLLSVSVRLKQRPKPEEMIAAWQDYTPGIAGLQLPSLPSRSIRYTCVDNRPQPRLDRDSGNGMTIWIGRLRSCNVLDYHFSVLGHNTIRGAAGGSILVAELLAARNLIAGRCPLE
ncbi:aspartate-semialdehyde dehydrogenase [bacterium]|nr:aspartate-semialdehyde dehydrogenase [candidate division CSSED10-310 bacterium]